MPEEFRCPFVQFQIEHARLQSFSHAVGLTENVDEKSLSQGIRNNKALLLSILTEIEHILAKFAKDSPYESDSNLSNQSHNQENLGDAYSSLGTQISVNPNQEKNSAGLLKRFNWSLFRKDEFVKLVQRLRQLNNYLLELLDEHQAQILQDTQ